MQSGEADALLIVIVRPPVNTTGQRIARALNPLLQDNPLPVGVVLLQDWDEAGGISEFHQGNMPVLPYLAKPTPEAASFARSGYWKYSSRLGSR